MRILGLLGLVLALVIVGLVAKRQLAELRPAAHAPAETVRGQAQNIEQQYKQAIESAMQSASRELPAEAQ